MTHLCPNCGHNFTRDIPIEKGRWSLAPTRASYDGEPLKLTPGEAGVLHTIAKANGAPVKVEALQNRHSYSDASNTATVLVHRLRRKLGPAFPIETVRGEGYRWREA